MRIISGLAVVNDRAKRGVALIKKLTAREEQLEFLLQVVSDHRRKFLDCSEKTFMATYSGKLVINFNTRNYVGYIYTIYIDPIYTDR